MTTATAAAIDSNIARLIRAYVEGDIDTYLDQAGPSIDLHAADGITDDLVTKLIEIIDDLLIASPERREELRRTLLTVDMID